MTRLWSFLNQPLPTAIAGAVAVGVVPVVGITLAQSLGSPPFRVGGPTIIALSVAALLCFLVLAAIWRLRAMSQVPRSLAYSSTGGLYGTRDFDLVINGVPWRFRIPRGAPWYGFDPATVDVRSISVDIPPRCPGCGTELEQHPRFWGGFLWKCIACSLTLRRPEGFSVEAQRALKIARREWERNIPELRRQGTAS